MSNWKIVLMIGTQIVIMLFTAARIIWITRKYRARKFRLYTIQRIKEHGRWSAHEIEQAEAWRAEFGSEFRVDHMHGSADPSDENRQGRE